MSSSLQPFAAEGVAMCRAGFAVLPASGKTPLRGGFNKWNCAPGIGAVENWAARDPEANIVYVPGLSRVTRNGPGLVVVDADNAEEVDRVAQVFGETPGKVTTRRGKHFLYRAPDKSLGNVGSLRKLGFDIDIKHGQSGSGIVVAPPSTHPDQREFAYRWDGCDHTVIRDLPPFNVRALQDLIEKGSAELCRVSKPHQPDRRRSGELELRQGSRGLSLNDYLAKHAPRCETLDEVIDVAQTHVANLVDHGYAPLEDAEVVSRAKAAWQDVCDGKLVAMAGKRATAQVNGNEVDFLLQYRHGADAIALLMKLRSEHGARLSKGGTFVFVVDAMVRARTMGSWDARRYRRARDLLVEAGYMKQVSPPGCKRPAQYVVCEHRFG